MKQQQYNQTYKVGIYTRLSNEDTRDGDSVSIENQKLILTNYADKNRWEVADYYVDDGFSGANFNRPAIKRLIADVQSGKINLVLVKDQSRFGRNAIEAGVIKQTFEENNVRLIAVDDNLDTANGFDIMSMFRDVFNEWFIADTSKKIRAVKRACAESGKFMGYKAPFGYVKSPNNKHKLEVDPPAAAIVRKIFDLRCSGFGFRTIAFKLNEENVITPKQYHPNTSGRAVIGALSWNANTVSKILRNEVYIGNMVQCKVENVSYKCKRNVRKPEENWIRAENTHEPIIDSDVWKLVCELDGKIDKLRSTNTSNEPSLFAGLLRCLDCGYNMKHHRSREFFAYICGRYSMCGKTACTYHYIGMGSLKQLVLSELRKHADRAFTDESDYRDELLAHRNEDRHTQRKADECELKRLQKRVAELENLIQSAFEDKVSGTLSAVTFKNLSAKYESERDELIGVIGEIETRLSECENDLADVDSFLSALRKYANIEQLDREILLELIDTIEIGEIREESGEKVRDVVIHYRFVDTV